MAKAKKETIKEKIVKQAKPKTSADKEVKFLTLSDKEELREFNNDNFVDVDAYQNYLMKQVWDFYINILTPMANGNLLNQPRLGSYFQKDIDGWLKYQHWLNDPDLVDDEQAYLRTRIAKLVYDFEDFFGMNIDAYGLWTRENNYREMHSPFDFIDPEEALF